MANVLIDVLALMIFAVLYGNCILEKTYSNTQTLYRKMLLVTGSILTLSILSRSLDGNAFWHSRSVLYITNALLFIAQGVYCFLWMLYAENDYYGKVSVTRVVYYSLPTTVLVIVMLGNVITKNVFIIDQSNHYQGQGFYYVNFLVFLLYMIWSLILNLYWWIKTRSKEGLDKVLYFGSFMAFPVAGVLIDFNHKEIAITGFMMMISMLMIYVNVQRKTVESIRLKKAESEKEQYKMNVDIMMSQMQPHFLFNALNVIMYQTMEKDDKATETISHFSTYLRGNLRSINVNEPISFVDEIEHLKSYLYIEKLRFPDIEVIIDTPYIDFMLPVLTVQPLVENAIRYSVSKRDDSKGTVRVTTWVTQESIFLEVKDDGIGFDPEKVFFDGHSRIGISYTRERIKQFCGGKLFVKTEKNKGTTVTIQIKKQPKERNT